MVITINQLDHKVNEVSYLLGQSYSANWIIPRKQKLDAIL